MQTSVKPSGLGKTARGLVGRFYDRSADPGPTNQIPSYGDMEVSKLEIKMQIYGTNLAKHEPCEW